MTALRRRLSGVAAGLVLLAQAEPAAAAQPTGHLIALNSATGHQQWSAALPTASVSSPLLAGDTVVVAGTNDCRSTLLTAVGLDTTTGRSKWRTTVGSSDPCSYGVTGVIANGIAVVGGPSYGKQDQPPLSCVKAAATPGGPTSPVALSAATGHVLWRAPLGFATSLGATPTVAIGSDVTGTCLVGLDLTTGNVLWTRRAGIQLVELLVTPTGTLLWARTRPAVEVLEGLNLTNGTAQWTATLSKPNDSIQVLGGDVATVLNSPDVPKPGAVNDTTLDNYDPATGKVLWRARGYEQFTGYSGGGGALLVLRSHPTQNQLTWLDSRTGKKRWSLPPQGRGGVITALTDGKVVIGVTANTLVGLSPATGKLRWTAVLDSNQVALGAGQLFVTQPTTPKNPPGGD